MTRSVSALPGGRPVPNAAARYGTDCRDQRYPRSPAAISDRISEERHGAIRLGHGEQRHGEDKGQFKT